MSLPIAVLVSGRGSNLRAIFEAIDAERCRARVVHVISDRAGAPALELASARAVPTSIVSPKDHADRPAWDAALAEKMAEHDPALIVLAGFMRIVGASVLERFGGRIINVHPALLPSFPGVDGPGQAVKARVKIAGCTVHLVDAGVDTGPILAQAAVPVMPDDTGETLHERIQPIEHRLLPAVIDWIVSGALVLSPEPRFTAPIEAPDALVHPSIFRTGAG